MIKFKLHDLLWQMRLTQKDLAEGAELTENTVSKLVRGDKDCKLSTIDKVCNYLQCKISDIIEFEKD
jgi:DNA-binding Xre family transcriptional regulator